MKPKEKSLMVEKTRVVNYARCASYNDVLGVQDGARVKSSTKVEGVEGGIRD